ncbi:MAG: hypothetical protein M5R36_08220 [Deltaproteobacteria bacterium]|nr:hypothetical protein [Deltaproteobacteria bacterium]
MHDLADPARGYPETSQIEFLPFEVRLYQDGLRAHLEYADLARIISLTPSTRFSRQASWKFRAGVTTLRDDLCEGCNAGLFEVGGGLAFGTPRGALTAWATGDAALLASGALKGIGDVPVALGAGPGAGLRWRAAPHVIALGEGQFLWTPFQGAPFTWSGGTTFRWEFARNVALDPQRPRPATEHGSAGDGAVFIF